MPNDKKTTKPQITSIDKFFMKLSRIPSSAKIFLLQNLSVIVKTGIPLADGMQTLGEQTKNKKLKMILLDVSSSIRKGQGFGESLEKYQSDFGEMFVNIIKAGEVSGSLEEAMKRLYIQTKKDHELKSKVKNALAYPIVILVAMVGISIFVILFVLPNLTNMFQELEIDLPLSTKILIAISDAVQEHGLIVGGAVIIILGSAFKLITTQGGKNSLGKLWLKLPIIAPIVRKVNIARMARSFSSLIKTDVDIVNTLEITSRTLGNPLYKKALMESAEKVKSGAKLESIFKNYPKLFPPIITQMISVGEETGALEEILENIADFYEEEVSQTMESLPTIIEPVLMVVMAIGVAGIAVSILMPMFSLTENF